MRHFARYYGEDEGILGMVGLLHDIDYGEFPEEHLDHAPRDAAGYGLTRRLSATSSITGTTCATRWSPSTPWKSPLHSGRALRFITACALVRPSKACWIWRSNR